MIIGCSYIHLTSNLEQFPNQLNDVTKKHLFSIDTKFTLLAILMLIFENTMTKTIRQLSVKFQAFCQLSVKWLLMINYETYLYIFDAKSSLKGTYNVN